MKRKQVVNSDSPLEKLRVQHTNLTQDQFVVQCGLSRATYFRWISGASQPKPTLEQIATICKTCRISFREFFQEMGFDITGIPDDYTIDVTPNP